MFVCQLMVAWMYFFSVNKNNKEIELKSSFFFFLSLDPMTMKNSVNQKKIINVALTFSWRTSLSYRNQSIDLQRKSMDWFLYNKDLRHERVKSRFIMLWLIIKFWFVYWSSIFLFLGIDYMREIGSLPNHTNLRSFLRLVLQNSKSLYKLNFELHESGLAHLDELVDFTRQYQFT